LLSLLRAPQVSLQLAAMEACNSPPEPELLVELTRKVTHAEPRIRLKLAQILPAFDQKAGFDALKLLLRDVDSDVRVAALKSTAGRPDYRLAQELALSEDTEWEVRMAAARALDAQASPVVSAPLFLALAQDDDG